MPESSNRQKKIKKPLEIMEEDSNYNEQVVLMDRIKDTISYQNKYTKW